MAKGRKSKRKSTSAKSSTSAKAAPPALGAFLRRLRRRRAVAAIVAVCVLAALVLADRHGWLLNEGGELAAYDGRWFEVARVIDGDTLDVAAPDGRSPVTRVRLWGIDTPELADRREGRAAEPLAEEAAALARDLCAGRRVRLHLESHRLRGRYGRVLAYVELPDGARLNERLLEAGLAAADDRWPHRHVERYELLEQQARFEKLGLWAK